MSMFGKHSTRKLSAFKKSKSRSVDIEYTHQDLPSLRRKRTIAYKRLTKALELINVVAYMYRFINKSQNPNQAISHKFINNVERHRALMKIVKLVQHQQLRSLKIVSRSNFVAGVTQSL
ncbi:hypothetical protein K1T71_002151 [Dendrolimus kikuchii]|uniref:Uncharacterized protein n=1 Tax=Dendrolimus kikuchii TaxID=765133 RepID=A0ACC1DH83_9NEOP|nr:hypothetical protein K1T71_002151 [Dendrolimus kikuchii]